jgi:hypothetical protein
MTLVSETPPGGGMRMLCLFGAALPLAAVVVATACASRSDLTAVSSKNVNLSGFRLDRTKSLGRTTGTDCVHIVIFIPTGGPPTIDEALDRALEAKHANLLTDAVVRWSYFYIPYLYGRECWTAEGDAHDTYQ